MDIQQLRGWADIADRALVISIVVALLAVVAVAVSAFFSVRFAGAIRVEENAAFDRYRKEWGRHAADLQEGAAQATARIAELEKAAVDADQRAAQAGKESASAHERVVLSELEVTKARARIAALEKLVGEARSRPPESEKTESQAAAPAAQPEAKPIGPERQKSRIAESLAKFAGAKAAIYTLEEAPEAADVGSSINAILADAGWSSETWRWAGVSGILGVVVLVRTAADPATDATASGLVDALRSDGFNAAKATWPADWRRVRGTLHGPQTPGPADAPIRIVIGAKAK